MLRCFPIRVRRQYLMRLMCLHRYVMNLAYGLLCTSSFRLPTRAIAWNGATCDSDFVNGGPRVCMSVVHVLVVVVC